MKFPKIDPLLRNMYALTTLAAGFKANVISASAEGTVIVYKFIEGWNAPG